MSAAMFYKFLTKKKETDTYVGANLLVMCMVTVGTDDWRVLCKNRSFKRVAHFSGASGSRSITYFPRATLMIGAPGILLIWRLEFDRYSGHRVKEITYRIRLLRSRSFVAIM